MTAVHLTATSIINNKGFLKVAYRTFNYSVMPTVTLTHLYIVVVSLPGAGAALFYGDGGVERSEV